MAKTDFMKNSRKIRPAGRGTKRIFHSLNPLQVQVILIYVTCPNKEEARKIARHLIAKKLVACANIYENVNSLYPWKGGLADETETVLILKTTEVNYKKTEAEIEKIHSYTCPCIIKIPVSSNKKYFDWLCGEAYSK